MKRAFLSTLFVLALLSFPRIALADSTVTPPPGWSGSYSLASLDGRYILVMLDGVYKPPSEGVSANTDEQNKLLLKYSVSGLYRNDGTNKPLWVMDYISWRSGITLSSDGHHLIIWGEWPFYDAYGSMALAFFEDGRMLTMYSVRDLVVQPEDLPHSVSHYQWLLNSTLDNVHGLLNVETHNHEKYMFALNTGRIISAIIPTAIPGSKANSQRDVIVASISTTLPKPEVPVIPSITPTANSPLFMGVLVSAGSLTMIFAGVNFLSAKARRKAASVYSSHSQFHVRKVTLDPARHVRKRQGD